MAAARYSRDVLQELYDPKQREENTNIPENNNFGEFWLFTTNFEDWLHAWRMDISERDPTHNDLLMFARGYKEKFVEKVKEEIKSLKSIKVSFGMEVNFQKKKKVKRKT